ncbi:MAG: GTP diphosphokinase [Gammaproteobacteria bacterium]|nr:MAG: GTP diphosphokinase [Gammaproteobacteria bacterium]
MVSVVDKLSEILISENVSFQQWFSLVDNDIKEEDKKVVQKAWDFAKEKYGDSQRDSGQSYFHHAISVASILIQINLDYESVSAGMLHDVLDKGVCSREELNNIFGYNIAELVESIYKMENIAQLHNHNEEGAVRLGQAEQLRKMIFATTKDVRGVIIKLAEQVQNMRTLQNLCESEQRRISIETRDIYSPLANLLGIWHVKWELEDLSFRYLKPDTYKKIAKMIAERRIDREEYIENALNVISEKLDEEGIKAEVKGRPKHIYSIWKKMVRKGVGYDELFDVRAVRVMVNTVAECYAVLGIVHGLWKHIPKEFDDYIATPKNNNYQSLHTAVIGPEGKNLEIQIRTYEMHENSELGIAAHWRYKDGSSYDQGFQKKINWLRQYIESCQEDAGEDDFVDQLWSESFDDRIYVLTPKGKVLDLSAGSTVIDFAYAIHTEVGHKCFGAKVNQRIVPLNHRLENGDTVEILTKSNMTPSRDWLVSGLGYTASARTRAKIRAWFKLQDLEKSIIDGREIIERELHRFGLKKNAISVILEKSRYQNEDELLAAIGRGDFSAAQIGSRLQEEVALQQYQPEQESLPISARPSQHQKSSSDIQILGVGNLLTHMAKCCKPVPNDSIVGFITRGRGVSIHRTDCANIKNLDQEECERLIDVSWSGNRENQYPVDIKVESYDRPGLLNEISMIFVQEKLNITDISTSVDKRDRIARMSFTVEISDISNLGKILNKIGSLPNIIDVRRISG